MRSPVALIVGLLLISPFALAADVSPQAPAGSSATLPSTSCEQKPAPRKKPTIYTTPRPNGQSNEIYVYCGDYLPSQTPAAKEAGDKGDDQKPDAQKAKPPSDKPPVVVHEVNVGGKDFNIGVKSPSPVIFIGTLILAAAILLGILWFIADRASSSSKGGEKQYGVIWLVGLLGLGSIGFIAYLYFSHQSSANELNDDLKRLVDTREVNQRIVEELNSQLRTELAASNRKNAELEINNRVLASTRERWPFTQGTPYLLFGFSVGLLGGVLWASWMGPIWVARRRFSEDERERESLIADLRRELRNREIEALKEMLRKPKPS